MARDRVTFGEAEARLIRDAGWRQGSIFSPPTELIVSVPFDRTWETLVVCSQSCAVVSPRIDRDPYVELMVAGPVEKYNPKCGEATGRVLRSFHLPISGRGEKPAVACDFNRRFFINRESLLKYRPDAEVTVSVADARNLAGWIARNYTRIALPDALAERAKDGLFDVIKTALRTKGLSDSVKKIYINYTPQSELIGGCYEVCLIFLCEDRETEEELNAQLEVPLNPYTASGGHQGIMLTYEIKIPSETFLSELDGYKRLTEWDYLSNLGDVADSEGLTA